MLRTGSSPRVRNPNSDTRRGRERGKRYRVAPIDFYLPYLNVATPRGRSAPPKVDRFGYRAISSLALEADELVAIADGAARAKALGDPALSADVASAMRKLAFDLPIEEASTSAEAVHARKQLRLAYRTMGRGAEARRTVQPYGFFFLNGDWFLAGSDGDRGAL